MVKAKRCICQQHIWAALLTWIWIWKKYFYSLNLSVLIHEMGLLEFPPDRVSWMAKKELCIRLWVRLVLRLPYSTEISSAHCSFLSCSSSHTEKVRRNKKFIFHNVFYKKFIFMYNWYKIMLCVIWFLCNHHPQWFWYSWSGCADRSSQVCGLWHRKRILGICTRYETPLIE